MKTNFTKLSSLRSKP